MNYLIPSMLLSTILIAGAFVFLPVQEAVTLHSQTVGTNQIIDGSIVDADVSPDALTGASLNDAITADSLTSETGNGDLTLSGDGTGDVIVNDLLTVKNDIFMEDTAPTLIFRDTTLGDNTDDSAIDANGGTLSFDADRDDGAEATLNDSGDLTVTRDLSAVGGYKIAFTGMFSDVGDDSTNNQVAFGSDGQGTSTTITDIPMPFGGSILGAAVFTPNAEANENITCTIAVNGSDVLALGAVDGNTQSVQTTQTKDTDTFSAGDRLSVDCDDTGTNALENVEDVFVTLVVEF